MRAYMESDTVFHNWLVDYLKSKFSKEYSEIGANPEGQENEEFSGHYPDIILRNHGMVMAIVEVETERSIDEERGNYWKEISQKGAKLILMVPESKKAKVT
jgi:hypothetical protein